MKMKIRVGIIILVVIFSLAIFSDWNNFKAGFFGKSPVTKVVK